jgi:hypothetical protein
MVIKRVGPLSCAKIAGVLHALGGLLFGAMFTLFALVGGFAGAPFPNDPAMPMTAFMGLFMGVGAIVFLPLFYGVMGFVVTLIGAFIYNLLAAVVGGIEIHVE